MLVLTRKQGEQILIDQNIRIMILRIKGKAVRVGIQAPDDIPVRRGELNKRPASPGLMERTS
jgi:carbon storage regulator